MKYIIETPKFENILEEFKSLEHSYQGINSSFDLEEWDRSFHELKTDLQIYIVNKLIIRFGFTDKKGNILKVGDLILFERDGVQETYTIACFEFTDDGVPVLLLVKDFFASDVYERSLSKEALAKYCVKTGELYS